jgi:hypothetical protein
LQDADSPHNTEGSREEEVVSGSIVKWQQRENQVANTLHLLFRTGW